jgi:hypothetical protein
MSGRRIGVKTLHSVLAAYARVESLVPDPEDRAVIAAAARVAERQERHPEVVVVGGNLANPVVDDLLQLVDRIDEMSSDLHGIQDHVDDILRLIRKDREVVDQ